MIPEVKPLSAHDIIRIWELGHDIHHIERALLILSASSGSTQNKLASLPVGKRDALLLDIRSKIFGDRMNCFATCPECGDKIQFTLSARSLIVKSPDEPYDIPHELSSDGLSLIFRLPDSTDQLAVLSSDNIETARLLIIKRCLLKVINDGTPIVTEDVQENAINLLCSGILELDPGSELLLDVTCASCGNNWQALFDIVTFFWSEISAEARRLLLEVHNLASAYGWSEAEILSMSALRRHYYLEMIG